VRSPLISTSIKFNPPRYNRYAKWTPGSPCTHHVVSPSATLHLILFFIACDTSGCSSGKVAGLIFFETFSFVWTSQVIGNVSLATLAGGPYGSWYYFGPRELGEMVCKILFFLPIPLTNSLQTSAEASYHLCIRPSIHPLPRLDCLRFIDRHHFGNDSAPSQCCPE